MKTAELSVPLRYRTAMELVQWFADFTAEHPEWTDANFTDGAEADWLADVQGLCESLDTTPEQFGELQQLKARADLAERLADALAVASETLYELSEHGAFADDAPEFNEGGSGYEARRLALAALSEFKALPNP